VRTQVDRDLTTVSRVDRLLRLNKNLGRHSSLRQPPSAPPFCLRRARQSVPGEGPLASSSLLVVVFSLPFSTYMASTRCGSLYLRSTAVVAASAVADAYSSCIVVVVSPSLVSINKINSPPSLPPAAPPQISLCPMLLVLLHCRLRSSRA
jgi:hypothetical protein